MEIEFFRLDHPEHESGLLKVGAKFSVGEYLNERGRDLYNQISTASKFEEEISTRTIKYGYELVIKTIKEIPRDELNNSRKFRACVELYYEIIRFHEFNDLPSRFKCFYAATDKENMIKWAVHLMPQPPMQALFCKGIGKGFRADSALLNFRFDHPNEIETFPYKYWRGDITKEGLQEWLFVGDIEVIRNVDDEE